MTRTDTSHPFPAIVALVLVLVPCGCADGYDHARDAVVRSLHNAEVDTGIWIADFTNLPERMDESFTPYTITEVQLRSTASAHIVTKPDHQQGAYAVGALQAEQLGLAVAAELYPVPASEATVATTVSFRGVRLVGKSQLEASADGGGLQKRIPTVFSPFHAGTKFNISDHPSSPGVAIHFTNLTLLLPNSTFAGIFDSGLMDFFEMGRFARFCFTDSILVLESCQGFVPKKYHMWCCTARQCNLLYTKATLEDLGYFSEWELEYIECVSRWDRGGRNSTASAGGSATAGPIFTAPVAMSGADAQERSEAAHTYLSDWFMVMELTLGLAVSAFFIGQI